MKCGCDMGRRSVCGYVDDMMGAMMGNLKGWMCKVCGMYALHRIDIEEKNNEINISLI